MTRFEDLNVGDVVVGEVTAVVPFGVFVRVADGADGLLHGENGPEPGAQARVRIVQIDREERRASETRRST